ncbi:MAG: DivIVA domain-containing protein [Acidimicrobiia bacterium]|nr:DivIVA domain-containing protein [Acidimicrobiia bacterium]
MLTPSDIEEKTFHNSLRGYDMHEVDDFLDEVVATVRDLTEKLEEARSKTVDASDESAVGRALVAAQATADRIIADANDEAAKIMDSAKSEAEDWMAEREEKKAAALAEMSDLKERVQAVRARLAELAEAVSGRLDEMEEVISSDQPDEIEGADEEVEAYADSVGDEDAPAMELGESSDSDDEEESGADDDRDPWSEPFGNAVQGDQS